MAEYSAKNLEDTYSELTSVAYIEATLTNRIVGGLPAGDKGLEAFCKHQLKLDGDELAQAVARIKEEEIGEVETEASKQGGEIKERESYGVNVLRRNADGVVWISDHQFKACIKVAASRLGLFSKKKGTKGDVTEVGRVTAHGKSAIGLPREICLYDDDGNPYTGRAYEKFSGRVNTPQGAKSIVHDSEIAPEGLHFALEFRFMGTKLTEEDIVNIIAMAQQIGLGSARAMECGKFRVDKLVVHTSGPRAKKTKGDDS